MTVAQKSGFQADALLLRVGGRVREARRGAGLSRSRLSELCGVSQRYLAQLEGGTGNISISLLDRVARALDRTIESFLSEQRDGIDALFNAADTDTQTEVLRLLGADQSGRASRVCLIGLRGAGKSTLGAAVGDALGVAFLELNDVIAEFAGIPVSEIMALYGIEGYRRLEADALEQVIEDHDRLILAAAGGIVDDGAVFTRLLEKFHTIWLRATPEDHMERVRAQGDTRPMAGNPAAMAELTAILTSREAQYAQAGAQMNTSGCSPKEARDALARLIANRGFLRALS